MEKVEGFELGSPLHDAHGGAECDNLLKAAFGYYLSPMLVTNFLPNSRPFVTHSQNACLILVV